MLSSTSSFRIGLATTVLLLLAYTFLLNFVGEVTSSQSQFQDNKVRLENFVFSPQVCTKAVLGSSLTFRLQAEDLGKDFCNLSFAGSSALTGLEVIQTHPIASLQDVYVEVNVLRDPDPELMTSATGLSYGLKKYLPFFQNRFQPMTLAMNYLRKRFPSPPPVPTESQFQFWLNVQQESYAEVTPNFEKGFDFNLSLLREQISRIEASGLRVHLIEIPMHGSLLTSTKNSYQRNRLAQIFPDKKLLTDPAEYATDDGLHLNFPSAQRFSNFLKDAAQ